MSSPEAAPFDDVRWAVIDHTGIISLNRPATRNALTHEYPDDPQRQALTLNAARQAAQQLNQWLEKISLKMT